MTGFYWLASYPKSGNTWLRLALSSVRKSGASVDFTDRDYFAPITAGRRRFDTLLGLASSDLTPEEICNLRPRVYELHAKEALEPIFNKVHDGYHMTHAGEPLFPPALTLGSIYLLRDPRDIAVSLAAHIGRSIDDTITLMNDPAAALGRQIQRVSDQLPQSLGTWSTHVTGWLAARGARPPLLLRYEAMLDNPDGELRRALAYIGWDVPDAVIDRAVAATRFDALQTAETRDGFHEKPPVADRFFRRGKAGGWRDSLTDAQCARIEADHGGVMRQLGYL